MPTMAICRLREPEKPVAAQSKKMEASEPGGRAMMQPESEAEGWKLPGESLV
jgi:hypothetical protein